MEDDKPKVTQASQSEETSKDNVDKDQVSMECENSPDTVQKTVIDCATESFSCHKLKLASPENVDVSPSPSITEADKSGSRSLNFDVELSDKGQKLTNLDCHMPIAQEDLQVVKGDVIHRSFDDGKPEDNVAAGEIDSVFPCKVLDGDMSNTNFSSTADGSNSGKENELGQYTEDLRQPGCEGVKSLDVLDPCQDQKLNQMNDQIGGDDGEVVKQVGHLNEESIQMTPPDAEIFGKPEVEGNGVDREDNILQNKDHCLGKLSNGINHGNTSLDYNTRHNSNSKCKGVRKLWTFNFLFNFERETSVVGCL